MWPAAFAAVPRATAGTAPDITAEAREAGLNWGGGSKEADVMWPAAFAAAPSAAVAGDASDRPAEPHELDWGSISSEADVRWPDAANAEPPAAADAAPDSPGTEAPPPQRSASAVDMAGAE